MKSFDGCWTCRLRRKKCDENYPLCKACCALNITCYYGQEKPEWMDGGMQQKRMAQRLKQEVKENAFVGVGRRTTPLEAYRPLSSAYITSQAARSHTTSPSARAEANLEPQNENSESRSEPCLKVVQGGPDCTLEGRENVTLAPSDTVLLMFYIEHLLPFLFPFYRPSILQGGVSWVLQLVMSSRVVTQAILCQSSYFFSLNGGALNRDSIWDRVLIRTEDAFKILRKSLLVINDSDVTEHLHGAVRVLVSILQMQRFEIAVSSFDNCRAHLDASRNLFKQVLDSHASANYDPGGIHSSFQLVLSRLETPNTSPTRVVRIPSAEQSAFRFTTSLLIFDDIIASTVLQQAPELHEYHRSLLGSVNGNDPIIELDSVIGCPNWVLIQISEIAMLDSWKQRCKVSQNLDVMDLVHRATSIKQVLENHLRLLETGSTVIPEDEENLLSVINPRSRQQWAVLANETALVTRVWAHAALIYLSIVVSGWQPSSGEVRCHVQRIVELLLDQSLPSALVRTVAWPFCVGGCIAEPTEQTKFRAIATKLQPPSVFGTLHKAIEIMENVWGTVSEENAWSYDLAKCFRSQGNLILLV